MNRAQRCLDPALYVGPARYQQSVEGPGHQCGLVLSAQRCLDPALNSPNMTFLCFATVIAIDSSKIFQCWIGHGSKMLDARSNSSNLHINRNRTFAMLFHAYMA